MDNQELPETGQISGNEGAPTGVLPTEAPNKPDPLPPSGGGELNFAQALHLMRKAGARYARRDWNKPGQDKVWIEIQTRDSGSKMTVPYLYKTDRSMHMEKLMPWTPNAEDIFTPDWYCVRENA